MGWDTMSVAHAGACPLCLASVSVIADPHPGYQANYCYRILECEYCDLQFTDPMTIPCGLYENIYSNADRLPGYDRYCRYCELTQSSDTPLDLLAAEEPAYWFIRSELAALPSAARILEIGSGLGYLTYAIHDAGYNITGIDISNDAVTKARSRFGDLYLHKDLAVIAAEEPGGFDAVIMTEVIEHVPDPRAFLETAAAVLKTPGKIFVTTPNKSDSPLGTCWNTENPPVHLWWFSETAMRRLAQMSSLSLRICDFTPMYIQSESPVSTVCGRPAWLDASGDVSEAAAQWIAVRNKPKTKMASLKRYPSLKHYPGKLRRFVQAARRVKRGYSVIMQRNSQMGVVLTKKLAAQRSSD